MKRMLKGLFSLCLLFSLGTIAAANCSPSGCSTSSSCSTKCSDVSCGTAHTAFVHRSQSVNAARELVGQQEYINRFEMDKIYGAVSATFEYTRSFKGNRIAGFLFGQDYKTGQLTISGSQVANRGANDLLADYFGLPTDFESKVSFKPRITNFLIDFNAYIGLDEVWEGAYFRIHAPLVHTHWNMRMSECDVVPGTNAFLAGVMAEGAIGSTRSDLPADFADALSGAHTFGDMKEARAFGKIAKCKLKKTRLSDIQAALGWNFVQDEDYHVGLNLRGSAPTGNSPEAVYLFEPIVGNYNHWELGLGLTSHAVLWTSDDEESDLSVYLDANVTHLFKNKQQRSFDFKNKPNSRYMLIAEMKTPSADLFNDVDNSIVKYQYAGNLFPAINKTTCCVDVSIAVQADVVLKFAYNYGNWNVDLGYNLWARSGEKYNEDCCKNCCFDEKKFVLKGDAHIIGFETGGTTARALSASQNKADIHAGTNTPVGTAYDAVNHILNPSIDNAVLASYTVGGANIVATSAGSNQTRTSHPSVFITCDDLDVCKGPSAISHKVFGHLNYSWKEDAEEGDWIPFIGVGGEVEFGTKSDSEYSALSQWGVWVKGGLAFD